MPIFLKKVLHNFDAGREALNEIYNFVLHRWLSEIPVQTGLQSGGNP